jgi:hypothetical protein
MLAFHEPGKTRLVSVPNAKDYSGRDELLEAIFHYGQNEVQPIRECCSVSVDDVIELNIEGQAVFYRVARVGFEMVRPTAFEATTRMQDSA